MFAGAPPVRSGPRTLFGGRGGFTLVELMIVVAILGILSTIAVPTFMRMRERARVAEAKANLGAIRVVQYAYFAEYNVYVGNQGWTPDRTADPAGLIPWDANTRFSLLGYAPEGRVRYSYSLAGGDYPAAFTARARSDLDLDGDWAVLETSSGTTDFVRSGGLL